MSVYCRVKAPQNVSLAGVGVGCPRCRPRHASARRRCGRYTPARAVRMAPGCVGTLCAGVTHGPGGRSLCGRYAWPRGWWAVVCICYNRRRKCYARPAQDPALPHSASSQSDARPSQSQRETTLRADRPASGLGSTRSGRLAHSTQLHAAHHPTASRYTTCRHPARNSPAPRITGGPGYRLTGTGLGDVAVRLRRASLRPGPATADGFARLRLRRQAPDIPGRWSRATGTWHMTPRDSPWGGTSHPHRRG